MLFDMPNCGGCRTCEIACSFKNTGTFAPSISSLKIIENKFGRGYKVLFAEESSTNIAACDGCHEHAEPLCVQFCRESEELERLIKEYLQKRKLQSKEKEV